MASFVVNQHTLRIRCSDLTNWTGQLRMTSFLQSLTVLHTRFASTPVGRGRINLGRDFLGCVLLGLGFARHSPSPPSSPLSLPKFPLSLGFNQTFSSAFLAAYRSFSNTPNTTRLRPSMYALNGSSSSSFQTSLGR
ncbi:hypothetical protein Mapa_018521 [Marchantia paleacea]|nr:hypothetical protein Mapa_018521 [Marchantia paleacea]